MTSVMKTSFIQLEVAVSSLANATRQRRRVNSRFARENIYFRPELVTDSQSPITIQEDSIVTLYPQAGEEGTEVKTIIVSFLSYLFIFLCLVQTKVSTTSSALFICVVC